MILKNKIAIITGASEGLGREVAFKLAKAGVNLALIARSKEKLEEIKKQIKGVKVEIYPCDLKDLKNIKKTVDKINKDFKTVNILLNIAGVWQKKLPLEKIDEQVINEVITTNLTGLIYVTKYTLPMLKKQPEAAIINVSSKSGVTAQLGQSVYSATKWGVRGFTEVLKTDLKESNIRVAGVYQSGVKTDMFAKTGEVFPQGVFENFMDPKDLANIIIFMLAQPPHIWIEEVRVDR